MIVCETLISHSVELGCVCGILIKVENRGAIENMLSVPR